MVRCQIKGCEYSKSIRFKPQDGTTFHHFPPDPVRREVWCQLMRLHSDPSFKPIMQPRLCSAHFHEDDFKYTPKGVRYLKKTAIPRIGRDRSPSPVVKTDVGSHKVHKRVYSNVGNGRKNICRSCRCDGASEHMFNTGSELAHLYTECTNLKAEPGDGLSQYICEACCTKLTYFSEFRKNCIYSYNALKKELKETNNRFIEKLKVKKILKHETRQINKRKTNSYCYTQEHKGIHEKVPANATAKEQDETVCKVEFLEHNTFKEHLQSHSFVDIANMTDHTNTIAKENDEIVCKVEYLEHDTLEHLQSHSFADIGNVKDHTDSIAKENDEIVCNVEYLEHDTLEHLQSHSFADIGNVKDHTDSIAKENDEIVCKVEYLVHDTFKEHLQSQSFADIGNLKEQHETVCKVEFEEHDIFKGHLQSHSFADSANSKDHSTTIKKNILPNMTCPVCKANFQDSTIFGEHLRSHKFIEITTKRMTKPSKQVQTKHVSAKKKILPLQCRICKRVMKDRETLRQHKKISHTKERSSAPNNSGETDICHICGKTVTVANYQNHILSCTNEKLFACNVCNKKFNTQGRVNRHMSLHMEKKYFCDYCQKGFTGRTALILHIRIHIGWRVSCTICGKSFAHFSMLAIHRRLHTGERPYRCNVCKKGYICKNNLDRHKTTHSSERPHQCQYCGNKYKEINSLRRHLKTQCKIKLGM